MSPCTLKGDFPILNCINQRSLSACLRTDNFSSFAAVHNPFTLLPDKLTDLILVYDEANAKLCMQRSYQESEHFCISYSLARTLQQRYCRPLHSYHTTFKAKKSDQQSQEQNKKKKRDCFFKSKKEEIWKLSHTLETEKLDPFTKQLPQTYFPLLNSQEFKYIPSFSHHRRIKGFTLDPSEKDTKSLAFFELSGTQ